MEGDSSHIIFNSNITTERGGHVLRGYRYSGEKDVYVTRPYSTAEYRIYRHRIREERGRRGNIIVSRRKVRLISRTEVGNRTLLEDRIGEAVSSGSRI
jgi:hypothetical protein